MINLVDSGISKTLAEIINSFADSEHLIEVAPDSSKRAIIANMIISESGSLEDQAMQIAQAVINQNSIFLSRNQTLATTDVLIQSVIPDGFKFIIMSFIPTNNRDKQLHMLLHYMPGLQEWIRPQCKNLIDPHTVLFASIPRIKLTAGAIAKLCFVVEQCRYSTDLLNKVIHPNTVSEAARILERCLFDTKLLQEAQQYQLKSIGDKRVFEVNVEDTLRKMHYVVSESTGVAPTRSVTGKSENSNLPGSNKVTPLFMNWCYRCAPTAIFKDIVATLASMSDSASVDITSGEDFKRWYESGLSSEAINFANTYLWKEFGENYEKLLADDEWRVAGLTP